MLIIADSCGGLGNRLWTLANVAAWGIEHNRSILTLGLGDVAERFPGLTDRGRLPGSLAEQTLGTRLAAATPRGLWRLAYRVNLRTHTFAHLGLEDHEMLDLDATETTRYLLARPLTFLTGFYYVAVATLNRHAEAIRALFRPEASVLERADHCVSRGRMAADRVVGVHVRHGDYRTFANGMMFYSSEEYANLMHYLKGLWPGSKVAFVVCSDEPQPASVFEGLAIVWGPGDLLGDLYSLASCDCIVGPSSTFSRWASFWGRTPLWRMDWRPAEREGLPVDRYPEEDAFSVCDCASHLVTNRTLPQRVLA